MNSPLRALLVDDERPARKWLRELLLAHKEITVAGEADGVQSAIALARQETPDVIFLDVQMPPGSGFDVLPQLVPLPKIVFVTAYDTFAVKAFEANALDYLLKPVHPERLAETIRRLLLTSSQGTPSIGNSSEHWLIQDIIPLRDRGLLRMVPVGQIAAIEAEAAYTRIHIADQDSMLVLRAISEWETRLPFPPFVRIDRSRIVNLTLVRSLNVLTRDETRISFDGISDPLVLGRSASARLRKFLQA